MVARGVALIASQWSWDADWSSESNEPAPLSLWHCDPELCSIEKRFQLRGRPISWAVPTPLKVNGANFSTLLPPRGATFTPFWVWSYRACQPLQMWQISHFCEIHSLSYEASNFFRNVKSMGQIWDAPAPQGVQLLPHFEVWSYRACQPLEMWQISHFLWNPLSELRGVKVFLNVKSMRLILPLFCPWGNIVPPIAYKSHSTRFPIRPHVLTPHSWLCDKNCERGVARRNKVEEEEEREEITRMYISRRKCEMVLACSGKKTPPGC